MIRPPQTDEPARDAHPSGNASRPRLALWATVLAVTALAAHLHSGGLHDVIAWDEAHYVMAARKGIVANATQLGELSKLRHRHAPLMTYLIAASTSTFGQDEWAVRLPAVIFATFSCGLLVLAGYDLSAGRHRLRLAVGAVAGLTLATSPASMEMAGVIQPHTFAIFFLILNIWTLCRYLRDLRRRDAVLFGLSLAGQFVAMEYGLIIAGFALISVALAHPHLLGMHRGKPWIRLSRRLPVVQFHRDIRLAIIVCLGTTALVWPAGVFLLGIPFNLAFFILYAANGQPVVFDGQLITHVPKYAYAWWYGQQFPLLLVAMIAAILLIFVWAWRRRDATAVTVAVFTTGLIASVHASHIMQLCKSLWMIPPIALGGPLAAAWLIGQRSERAPTDANPRTPATYSPPRLLAPTAAICLAFMAIAGGRMQPMSRADDPNQRLIAMCRIIADQANPGDRILAQGWPIVEYLLHLKLGRDDLIVVRYDPRDGNVDYLPNRLDDGEFRWAVTIGPTCAAYPDCAVLARLHQRWPVVADQSLPDREYRVYRRPAAGSVARGDQGFIHPNDYAP